MAVGPPWSPPLLHSGACRLVARLASCRGNAVPVFPQGRPVNSKLTSWLASPDTSGVTTSRNVRPSIRGLAVQSSGNGSGKLLDTADRAKEGASLHIKGRLELITGPMFAGKTSELIKRASEEEVCARRVVVVKSKIDNRYSTDEVVTHDGLRRRCFAVSQMRDLRAILGTEAYNEVQVVAIDEAQFFSDLLEYCEAAVDLEHKTVLVAGLSGDYRRKPFGQVHELLPLADSVTVLQAKCALCKSGEPAIFTRRLADGDSVQLVGGADKYIPLRTVTLPMSYTCLIILYCTTLCCTIFCRIMSNKNLPLDFDPSLLLLPCSTVNKNTAHNVLLNPQHGIKRFLLNPHFPDTSPYL